LRRVVPVAEKANVKLAMHPDDPPLSPIRGVARSCAALRTTSAWWTSCSVRVNGITLCQGNFTLMTDNLPDVIRHSGGRGKVFFVHFPRRAGDCREVRGDLARCRADQPAECMRATKKVGFEGVLRPDHVPTVEGDSTIGRAIRRSVGCTRSAIFEACAKRCTQLNQRKLRVAT